MHGRMRCWNHPHGSSVSDTQPIDGRRWVFTAKRTTRIMASQKSGMAIPRLEPKVIKRSSQLPGCVPARIPAGIPISNETNIAPSARLRVTGNFSLMFATTVPRA